MRVSPLTLLAVLLLACDADPVAPPEPVRFALSVDRAADFASALEDLTERVLPHLDRSSESGLTDALDGIAGALGTRSVDDLERALGDSDASLVALAAGTDAGGIAPDLEAVRLVLLQARRLLDSPSAGP